MNDLDRGVIEAIADCNDDITAAIELIVASQRAGGRLIYIGAGTAGRLGVLDAAECGPTFSVEPDKVLAVVAGGFDAVARAVEGAEDDHVAGASDTSSPRSGPQRRSGRRFSKRTHSVCSWRDPASPDPWGSDGRNR